VGVACASVKARIDPSRGTRVEIVLEAGADRIRAQSVIGQFPQHIQLVD
jgi:hypothetical protein